MGKTREIKKRIKAVANIRRITKTMQMIATAKFAAAQGRALASKPYTRTLFELVSELSSSMQGDGANPLARTDGAGVPLTLVLTSDRGLCGAFNGSVLRTATAFARQHPEIVKGQIELVGRKGVSILKFNRIPIARQHSFGDKPAYARVSALADDYIRRFASGELSAVRVIFMRFISAGRQTPEVFQLLPFVPPEGAKKEGRRALYEFSPSAPELLNALLPAAVRALLFQAFQDAVVSEHVARMVAMKSATDNAGRAGKLLTRQYNRARQAQITTELTEIISGAAALV